MSETKPLQRIFLLFSMVAFVASTGYGLFGLFSSALQKPQESGKNEAALVNKQLEEKAKGYELVLQREPENQVALKGLVDTRLEMKEVKSAIEPLEKLVKLNPEDKEYKVLLEKLKQEVGVGSDR
ncbi:tetratricopeptide repeat protein [Limnofasciculus baicalensis]|uniref:Tetratricopeptide repeat protein n=1 Tax=Limnofasciculus baicalensis BBK-W-15 TaxID=2699891 RepID=A0AAE3GQ31_9CYAN|nr:tetratricopeptide repeat protein [Limnofasciculus baicalensis]MCP2728665.1 tetratricopeptide repeat protein [Limnofasciculus baicalensis BBK-W-15]